MIKERWLRITLLVCLIIVMSISPCLALKRVVPENTKEAIVNKYLKGRALDEVEGIWYFTVNNYYGEVAVFKNSGKEYPGYEYLGVYVDSNTSGSIGDVKIALKKTDGKGVYTGLYIAQGIFGSSENRTYFVLASQNVLETKVPDIGWVSFVRITGASLGSVGGGGTAKVGSGTGFFVTPMLVVTNEHVVAGATKVEITFKDEYTLPAKVVAQDKSTDVAVLLVEGLENRVKPLVLGRTASVKEGERVYATGFPMPDAMGTRIKITEGIINALTGYKDDPKKFQISVPIQPGNSGGPLITADGRVIGITSSGLSAARFLDQQGVVPQNVNYAVKIDYIMPLLDIAGANVERKDKLDRLLDPVAVMEMAKDAVVFIKVQKE